MYTWSRRGGYECSSKGDKRFSAFTARLPDGRTIEEHYQCDIKSYEPGGTNGLQIMLAIGIGLVIIVLLATLFFRWAVRLEMTDISDKDKRG